MEIESGEPATERRKIEDKPTPAKKSKLASGSLFTLKKWNAVAMWQWDVECDTCAICRVQVMGMWLISDLGDGALAIRCIRGQMSPLDLKVDSCTAWLHFT